MVHQEKPQLQLRNMPLQRRHLFDIIIDLVEEGDLDSGEYYKPEDMVFHLLLPYTQAGYDAPTTIVDHSQLLTEFYEN